MTVDRTISLSIARKELEECREFAAAFGWIVSQIDEEAMTFGAVLTSHVDNEAYRLSVKFDNYREYPLLIEFVPEEGKTLKSAYPQCNDGFFHSFPCICNPCSRKAYDSIVQGAPHKDWNLADWQHNEKTGSLKSIKWILRAIQSRIDDPDRYQGRMER
ncbi:MAG: hypothetical protein WBE40_00885 [Thermoplasmata archaeon]